MSDPAWKELSDGPVSPVLAVGKGNAGDAKNAIHISPGNSAGISEKNTNDELKESEHKRQSQKKNSCVTGKDKVNQ